MKNIFSTIAQGHGAPCFPSTKLDWEEKRREKSLALMCASIEHGNDELKHQLPVWTPHCAEFRNNHRAAADALRPLNRLMMDFDEKGHTDDIMRSLTPVTLDGNEEKTIGSLLVLLVEESVRRGTHVLVELPENMTADEAQQRVKEATGFEPDKAVKDVARCIYMVPEDHTRYVSNRLFEVASPSPSPLTKEDEPKSTPALPTLPVEAAAEKLFKGIAYADIIREWWQRNGGEPQKGERNVKLHQLAVNLRAICDNKPDVLVQVMPHYGLSDTEMRSIADSACKEPPKGISKMMKDILAQYNCTADDDAPLQEEEPTLTGAETAATPIRTLNVKALPIGLKESLAGVPENMRMPVLCGIMPIVGAYADGVEMEYADGNRQHLGLMSIIYGEQASGKSVVKNVISIWERQFEAEDAEARQVEDTWKARNKMRKATEKAAPEPDVVIRDVPVTISCSTLLKRMKKAQGHTLYSFCEELDTLCKTNGAGSWSAKYDVYRLAFDRGKWGQDYNSDQAESGVVNAAYNWTMLGTEGALRKCFKRENVENGLSSRILVAEMPDNSFARMSKYGKRTEKEEARIQEAVSLLRSYKGLIKTPRLNHAIEEWLEQKRIEAAKDIDRVKDTYRRRAAVIGFRCGVMHCLLSQKKPDNGRIRESKTSIDFCLMMADYCLEQQIRTFGKALEQQYVQDNNECQRYGRNHNVFDSLPETFCMVDLRTLKRDTCTESALRKIISRWMKDNWIESTSRGHWRKLSHHT